METMDMKFATEDCTLNKEDPVVPSQQLDVPILETFDVEFATESCSLKNQNDVPILETFEVEFASEGCSLKKENAVISSNQMDESNLVKDEPAKLELAGMETLDTEFATESSVKQDLSYISKESYPVGEADMSDDSKSSLSNINIGGSGPCMKEALTKRYPLRKKVAEFRDFPSLCGGTVKLESSSKVSSGRKVVQGLRATSKRKAGKKVDFYAQLDKSKAATKSKGVLNLSGHQPLKKKRENSSSDEMGQLVSVEKSGEDFDLIPQNFELNEDLFVTNTVEQTSDCSLKKEDSMVLSDQVDGDSLANDEPAEVELVGIKTMDTEFATEDCTFKKEDPVVSYQLDVRILETFDVEFATESCSLKNENAVISSHQMDKSTLANDEHAKLTLAGMETLDTEFVTEGFVKQDLSYISKALHPAGEAAMSDDSKSSLSNINIGGSCACMKEALTKRYAPRKKVAEFRDFPRLCEGNAPHLSQDECRKELSSLKEVAATDVKEAENNKRKFDNIVQADSAGNPKLHEKHNHHLQVNINSKAVVKAENMNTVKLESSSKVSSGRKVVRGLASTSEWKEMKRKGKKVDFNTQMDSSKPDTQSRGILNHSGNQPLKKKRENSSSADMGQLVMLEKNSLDPNENNEHFKSVTKSPGSSVNVFPLGCSNFSGHENDSVARNKVRKALRLFQAFYRKILQEAEAKPKSNEKEIKRFDLQAAKKLKEEGSYVNEGKNILGSVPGVEVGDEFQYRIELNIIGLHREIQGGIDYVKQKEKILATSIVASGGYADDLDNSDVLIYTGQGGNVTSSDKEPEDQNLERGNLALKNSSEVKNSVRVIRGSESMDGKSKIYVYDGLYVVESCWQDIGPHGKLVYKFRLRRIPGQAELALKEVKKSKKLKTREGLCVEDISYGKEKIPICAVNTIDNEKPPTFKYITEMIYPECCNLVPPKGCNCTNGCSDHKKCSCVVKNGGEIPFNHNGDIVEVKPLVYECGPKCKCPSTCHNRVSQLGINIRLEIFKTNSMGWGVRSLNSIPSGSFICEYIGEVLEEKEAEQRTSNDEYLFDIGNNKNNNNLWDGLSTHFPDSHSSSSEIVEDSDFTIDAAQFGNVGRFVNHSCSPNLYAQNVLYDHQDSRVPHIMLFAAENIPPLQELTYDYNYMIDTVRDSDGNIKKKYCFCGSVECTDVVGVVKNVSSTMSIRRKSNNEIVSKHDITIADEMLVFSILIYSVRQVLFCNVLKLKIPILDIASRRQLLCLCGVILQLTWDKSY